MAGRILVVEDDRATARMVELALESADHLASCAGSLAEARNLLNHQEFDLILCDLYLGDGTGLELLRESRSNVPQRPVIMFTAKGSIETAVEAIQAGAFDYLAKPFSVDALLQLVGKALSLLPAKSGKPVEPASPEPSFFVGSSPAMVELYKQIALAAPTDATVLITGETGTGKELVARSLHQFSRRPQEPFVAVNCGALSETLLESELFGHRQGAFTDARQSRTGLFESAQAGTLFLDEIGETSPRFQVKLLRALQEREVRPVGSNRTVKTRMRVVAASNTDLTEAVRAGAFRQDLFYRLSVVHLNVPALRERMEDLPRLAEFLIARIGRQLGRTLQLSSDAVQLLSRHNWPGNVRELENALERAAIMSTTGMIVGEDLAFLEPETERASGLTELEKAEREKISQVLAQTGGNKAEAARRLGIERKTLYRKAHRLGIDLSLVASDKS